MHSRWPRGSTRREAGSRWGWSCSTRPAPRCSIDCTGWGSRFFLDLKYHDIPNTVAGACRSAAEHGVWMLNVHACGGRRMMEAAREAVGGGGRPLVIAVTVPTSMDDGDLAETGVSAGVSAQVHLLARLARDCGLDGIVCSAVDLGHLRAEFDAPFLRVTPGIRTTENPDDQRRGVHTRSGDPLRRGLPGHRSSGHEGSGSEYRAGRDRTRHRGLRRPVARRSERPDEYPRKALIVVQDLPPVGQNRKVGFDEAALPEPMCRAGGQNEEPACSRGPGLRVRPA